MKNLNDKFRFPLIDTLRGFTIVLMIFFHCSFDLNYFKFIHVDILQDPFWYFLPRLIVFLFFFAVGMSLKLVHGEKINWPHFNKRLLRLVIWAGLISLVTKIIFPDNWIYFGTLHSIALISLLTLPLLKYERLALFLSLALFIPSIVWNKNIPFFEITTIQSFDYISPFPWVGAAFLGIFAVTHDLHKISVPSSSIFKSLNFLGKHSLAIYLLHQPILFGTIFLIYKYKN